MWSPRGSPAVAALLAALLLPSGSPARLQPFAGPYIGFSEKWHQCNPNEYDHTGEMHFSTTPFNPRTPGVLQKLTGNATFLDDFTDRYSGIVHLDSWSNNQWKEDAFVFKFPKDGCTTLQTNIPDVFRIMFNKNNYDKPRCPVSKGTYVFENEPVNFTFPNFRIMPYGHWRLKMFFIDGRRKAACFIVEALTIPK